MTANSGSLKFFCLVFGILVGTKSHENTSKGQPTHRLGGPYSMCKLSSTAYIPTTPDDSLCMLYMESKTFNSLPTKKLVFKFVHIKDNSLTLHGWRASGVWGRRFKEKLQPKEMPKLINSGVRVVEYQPDMYFGDVVLGKNDVRKIKNKIDGKKYVLFVPLKDGSYKIYVDDDYTRKPVDKANETGAQANPSPPKSFS